MTAALEGRRVVLGVSGSIAAYKALTVASRLASAGALVDAVLTRGAASFVSPLAFQALTHRPVVAELWDPRGPLGMDHLEVAQRAELLLVAPASAHLIAQLALGLASDALTTTALATAAPLLLAPAMEPRMWRHEATAGHVATLRGRGASFVGPVHGRMASGAEGLGRMAEPDDILAAASALLAPEGPLQGARVLVTAGPTREPLDPVRFLSNRSSGHMGYALAEAAARRGAAVQLISGPVDLPAPPGVDVVHVERAEEMLDAVLRHAHSAAAVILCAAVADFRPAAPSATKLPKGSFPEELPLAATPDIALALRAAAAGWPHRPLVVGFAAESDDVVRRGEAKRVAKGFDLIVATRVPQSFGDAPAEATLIDNHGPRPTATLPKSALAGVILDQVALLLGG